MRTITKALLCSLPLTSLGLAAPALRADDWPHWRGTDGNGVSATATPPTRWSAEENVRWKSPLPGTGSSSPIVVGDTVWVTSAVPLEGADESAPASSGSDADTETRRRRGRGGGEDGDVSPQRFILLAFDRHTGEKRWERVAAIRTPPEGHHRDHGFASASPCADSERVYAHFGSNGLFAYTHAGEPIWKREDFGPMSTRGTFGQGSSPTLHDGVLIVPWDHEGASWIQAVDARTGKTLWKTDRDEPSCWATPLVIATAGGRQVIASGQNFARGYDLATGEELWRASGQTGRPVASPVAGKGLVFVGSGFRGAFLGAFRPERRGDLDATDGVVWSVSRDTPDVPSLLLSGSRLYFHKGRSGVISCHDAVSGEPLYAASRVDGLGNVYASPVAAAGKVYLTGRDGVTVVIRDADELEILATNRLGEPVDATPALAGDAVFIRGRSHLWCLGAGKR